MNSNTNQNQTVDTDNTETFAQLGLSEALTETLNELGYETPTPIQGRTIPLLLAGHDLIGQAQTGTGKTAAFSLPMLDRLDLTTGALQALVLTPTRELAIQVAEAIHTYARHLGRLRVMPVYGGDSIQKQMARLRGPMHIVVGTPGRIIDHLRRGTLNFKALKMVVLDEADEMLRMGFLDDVEWILGQSPEDRQTALFSATMPDEIRRVTSRHLRKPKSVEIRHKTMTLPTIEQHYVNVSEKGKLNALTQILETEAGEGESIIIFARTKVGAADVAEKLQARGYEAEAMHGGMSQSQRESLIRRMRAGQVEIVVATDVAARGLDVEHIGQVINYDVPNDPESYVHRIGRTGRAGRTGKALLFVTPRETRMMREIEHYTGQRLTPKKLPTRADVAARRIALFKEKIVKAIGEGELDSYLAMVQELAEESGHDLMTIAAAAARLAHGNKPALPPMEVETEHGVRIEAGMVRLLLNVGHRNGVYPSHIVAAIANETGIPGDAVGAIDIQDDLTLVDVPTRFQDQVISGLAGTIICGRETNVRLAGAGEAMSQRPRKRFGDDRGNGNGNGNGWNRDDRGKRTTGKGRQSKPYGMKR